MAKVRTNCDPSLIVDVGMNDGSDTAYYLQCGFKVVAVEANPKLVRQAERRFQPEISNQRLKILNVGIAETEGEGDFWIAEVNDQWSSFSKPVATRRGATVQAKPVKVRCRPLSAVLREVGTPFYLKMDIEGHDLIGLESLPEELAPQYISVEFAHGMELQLLKGLVDRGYVRFKLLNQSTFTDKPPIFEHEIGFRVLRKVYSKAPPLRPVIRKLAPRSDFDIFHQGRSWQFPEGSSGPFGEHTYGKWMTADDIVTRYRRLRRKYDKAGAVFWWDLHAAA